MLVTVEILLGHQAGFSARADAHKTGLTAAMNAGSFDSLSGITATFQKQASLDFVAAATAHANTHAPTKAPTEAPTNAPPPPPAQLAVYNFDAGSDFQVDTEVFKGVEI